MVHFSASTAKSARARLKRMLARFPEIEVSGEAADGREAVAQSLALHPDLILMDLRMPECDGLMATRLIKSAQPEVRIVILTTSAEDEDLFTAIQSGACGYLLKSMEPDEVVDAVQRAVFHPFGNQDITGEALRCLPLHLHKSIPTAHAQVGAHHTAPRPCPQRLPTRPSLRTVHGLFGRPLPLVARLADSPQAASCDLQLDRAHPPAPVVRVDREEADHLPY